MNAVKGHGLGRLVDGSKFQKGKVFVQVDLTRQNGIPLGLRQTRQVHLLIKEVHHLLFGHAERDISDVKASRLARDGGPDHRDGRLGRLGHQGGWNLREEESSLDWFACPSEQETGALTCPEACIALYCMGVTCSNVGGGTSQ